MAEAIVDGTSPMTRFFCHRCSVEIEHLLPDYTCPRCSTGFIEELERGNTDSRSSADMDMEDLSEIEANFDDFGDPYDIPMTLITAMTAASRNASHRNNSFRRRPNDRDYSSSSQNSRSQQPSQAEIPNQIDSFIQELFFNLSGIGFGIPQGQAGQPVFDLRLFLGNPGDYVWGQHGLDTIVTQLLNQMDGTGPPPLPKKQIDEIPVVLITQSQVDSKLQCSVCWDDFVLEEPVRQLSCQHCYHEACIINWLELHATCPICRQNLGDQTSQDVNQDTVGPSLAALFRAANESSSSRTSSTSQGNDSRNDSPNDS